MTNPSSLFLVHATGWKGLIGIMVKIILSIIMNIFVRVRHILSSINAAACTWSSRATERLKT